MNSLGEKTPFTTAQVAAAVAAAAASEGNQNVSPSIATQPDWSRIPYPPPWFLQTQRLNIRPLHIKDAPQLAHNANDAETAAQMTDRFPHPYVLSDADTFINAVSANLLVKQHEGKDDTNNESHRTSATAPPVRHFAICLRVNHDAHNDATAADYRNGELLIGGIGVDTQSDVYRRGAEVGYWLARSHRGKGYATEALDEVVDWLFALDDGLTGVEGEQLLRISAGVFGGNERSVRVLERAGFVVEATLKDAVWKNGQVRDLVVLGLTRRQRDMKAAVRTVQG